MNATDTDIRHEIVALLPRLRRFALALAGSRDLADDRVGRESRPGSRRSA
jgi:DNA-directed RNA polymerase specialized sigma24 family protein